MLLLESKETKNKPTNEQPLRATVRIGNEFAHIRVTPSQLRTDLVSEALAQNITQENAEDVASRTLFSFEHLQNGFLGIVIPNKTGYRCALATDAIAKRVEKRYARLTQEAKEVGLTQTIDSIWRHERQHLIQKMDPEKQKASLRTLKNFKRATLSITGIIYMATTTYALRNQTLNSLEILGVLGGYTAAIGTEFAAIVYKSKLRPIEREAYKMEKPEYATDVSPFHIGFEK